MSTYYDGQILGLDTDGTLIQWNADTGTTYSCSETPAEFGIEFMTEDERRACGLAP